MGVSSQQMKAPQKTQKPNTQNADVSDGVCESQLPVGGWVNNGQVAIHTGEDMEGGLPNDNEVGQEISAFH